MFNFLDVSGNKALSNAESIGHQNFLFLQCINGQEFQETGIFGVMSSQPLHHFLLKLILNNFDFDNSADLKLEEILQDRQSLFDLNFIKNDQIEIDNQNK